jgi:hypothetical protein
MSTLNRILGVTIFCFCLISCGKDVDFSAICEQRVEINAGEYKTAPNDLLNISELEIIDDCLRIKFWAGGCNGTTWELRLIDSETIFYSYPPQRTLRLSLKNEELCKALIAREETYDISKLQIGGTKILLNIAKADAQILYEY